MQGSDIDNYYLVLGLSYSEASDAKAVHKSYRRLAKLCHPDKQADGASVPSEFYKLKEAMDTLTERRFQYDQVTFASCLVPLDLKALVEERGDGFAVCVSWSPPIEMTKPRFRLMVRSESFLRFGLCCLEAIAHLSEKLEPLL